MFCQHCGAQLKEGAAFCSECGNAVNSGQEVRAEAPAPDVPAVSAGETVSPITAEDVIGKEYSFKNNMISRYLLDYFSGSTVVFQFQETQLAAAEAFAHNNTKNHAVPYDDIQSFRFENKANILLLITGLCFMALGGLCLFGGIIGILLGLLFLIVGCIGIFRNTPETVFMLESRSGKPIKIRLRRIRDQQLREAFSADLTRMSGAADQTKAEKSSRKWILPVSVGAVLVMVLVVGLIAVWPDGGFTEEDVRDAYLADFDGMTIGKAFDSYFDNTSWRAFEATDGSQVVEFTGTFQYVQPEGRFDTDAKVQFVQSEEDKDYFYVYGVWLQVTDYDMPEEYRYKVTLSDMCTYDLLEAVYYGGDFTDWIFGA